MSVEPLKIGEQTSVDLKDCIQLGKFIGVWGVKGWLKVFSYSRPRKNIGQYKRWLLVPSAANNRSNKKQLSNLTNQLVDAIAVDIKNCKEQGQNIVACIDGIHFRDQAESLLGLEIYIQKSQLKPLHKGEYYWSDLIGCEVQNTQNIDFGRVTSIMETGANDVLVVQQEHAKELIEHLIPYSDDIVLSIDVENQSITIDWELDFLVQERSKNIRKKKQTKQERSEEVRLKKLAEKQSEDSNSSGEQTKT